MIEILQKLQVLFLKYSLWKTTVLMMFKLICFYDDVLKTTRS